MKAYTLGHTTSYDASLASNEGCIKLGTRPAGHVDIPDYPDGYSGGWLWASADRAEAFRLGYLHEFGRQPASFSVYELEISSWEECASPEPDPSDGVHRLLVDSPVVGKV
jgi:hypothetical protein